MLSIGKVAFGGEDYYLATTASGRDHFEGLVESDGMWLGAGASALGLTGTAAAGDLRRILRGQDPSTGEPLLRNPGRRRVAAFDCTFSVPKSVSLVQAFSPDETVRREMRLGHEAAVAATLDYLARVAIAGRVDGVDGRRSVPGDLLGVGFLHRLSRAGDPHLHTHVLVANCVTDPERGAARLLHSSGLFVECRTAGALYETHLRHELTRRLGVEWLPLEGRCWSDLKGLDRNVIREFSRRSAAIAAGLRAEGWQGPAAARAMAELTRPPKDVSRCYEEVLEESWERLFRSGITVTRLREVTGRLPVERAPDGFASQAGPWKEATLHELAARTLDGRVTQGDVIRARCSTARDGRSVGDLLSDTSELLADGSLLERGVRTPRLRAAGGSFPAPRPVPVYTTAEIVNVEAELLRAAESMVGARPGSVTVLGYPSGGRWSALAALCEGVAAWRAEGRPVVALAPGRLAAAALESCTGADGVAVSGRGARAEEALRALPLAPGTVVVLGDAQSYGAGALLGVLQAAARHESSIFMLAPEHAVAGRETLSNLAALGRVRPALAPAGVTSRHDLASPAGPQTGHRFAGVEVTVVGSLGDACREAARQLAAATEAGRPAVVVSADESVVAEVRKRTGLGADRVLHSRHLGARAGDARAPELIVIGGASVLRAGATAPPAARRAHVLVAPGISAGSVEGLGRAAEAGRPRYLVAELGRPGSSPGERKAWREVAAAVETYRQRWGVRDHAYAFGRDEQLSGERAARRAEREAVSREVAGLRIGRGREGPVVEASGLGRTGR